MVQDLDSSVCSLGLKSSDLGQESMGLVVEPQGGLATRGRQRQGPLVLLLIATAMWIASGVSVVPVSGRSPHPLLSTLLDRDPPASRTTSQGIRGESGGGTTGPCLDSSALSSPVRGRCLDGYPTPTGDRCGRCHRKEAQGPPKPDLGLSC